jgi:hypothetical protein
MPGAPANPDLMAQVAGLMFSLWAQGRRLLEQVR